jgi:hypothetical protein
MGKPALGRGGKWSEPVPFRLYVVQEIAAAAKFNQQHTEATLPSLLVNDDCDPANLTEGVIRRIHFRIKDAAGDSFILRLWRTEVDGSTEPYYLQMNKLFESDAVRLSDIEYDYEVNLPFKLTAKGALYYGLQWTTGVAPAGNVQGYIEVTGETMK